MLECESARGGFYVIEDRQRNLQEVHQIFYTECEIL